uniref:Uncharacterized protein n=1 Tax=Caenorhabditis japonica TaxID=281687 RepID=A0A8R1IX57_CAEJA
MLPYVIDNKESIGDIRFAEKSSVPPEIEQKNEAKRVLFRAVLFGSGSIPYGFYTVVPPLKKKLTQNRLTPTPQDLLKQESY